MGDKVLYDIDLSCMAKKIRKQREFMRYSRNDLAKKIGVTAKFICDIESGKKGLSLDVLFKISQALNLSMDYLLSAEEANDDRKITESSILESLKDCSDEQLCLMKRISEYYAAGTKVKDQIIKRGFK